MKIIVDKEHKYLLKKYTFCINAQGYPTAYINGKTRHLHKLIMGSKKGFVVDHINRNKLDNRLKNLRFITQKQNTRNRTINKNNTSGYTGIHFNKEINKWVARISPDNRCVHIGSFSKLSDAIKARKQAEIDYGFVF